MFDVLLHMLYRLTCGYFILLYLCCIVFLRLVFSFSLSSSLSSGYSVWYIVNSNGSNCLFWCFFGVHLFIFDLLGTGPVAPRGCCQSCPRCARGCARCACRWGDANGLQRWKLENLHGSSTQIATHLNVSTHTHTKAYSMCLKCHYKNVMQYSCEKVFQ